MPCRPLGEIAERREQRRTAYSALMPWRVRDILLVSSLYDSFTFQEDGNLTEMLFSEYLELNLSYAPAIEQAATAEEAIESIRRHPPDLVISMLRVGEMDVLEFGRRVKAVAPDLPLVLLAYDTRELSVLQARHDLDVVDRIYVWQGDARLFLAIIKSMEDRRNAAHDAETAGVKSLIVVEDSVRFYSAYLPLLYTEIMEQTQTLMAEGVNRMQKLMRMRARPKILLASSYEEGLALFHDHRLHVLGVIVDARFPRGGRSDPDAGLAFARAVKAEDPDIPVLMQSSETSNVAPAEALGVAFIRKTSPTLLREVREFMREYLGFGDFVFRRSDGSVVATASDLRGLAEGLRIVPDDSITYHATRNDFSTWLMARTEFDLAKALRPRRPEEFRTPGDLRDYLLASLSAYRDRTQAGLVAEFSGERFDPQSGVTKIGAGSLGGKGRGLAFVNSLLRAYEIEEHVPGVRIFVPPTAVLATGAFDRFMETTGLAALVLGELDDDQVREAFLAVELPPETMDALRAFLARVTYPLAVRSSSLLEDSSYQPFAGIYQTYMLPNNDPDHDLRVNELSRAIRLVYASTYYADSKSYIAATPNRLEEEKMAVVIQPVVGRRHGDYLYPDIAGVVRSYDYYPMHGLHAEDGVACVALGLGRTVVDGGRCVRFCPAQPGALYQFTSTHDYQENAQRQFYAIDLAQPGPGLSGRLGGSNLALLGLDVAHAHGTLAPVGSVYSPENDIVYPGADRPGVKLVTMAGVLSGGDFPLPEALCFLLGVGKAGLSCHVEIEFAVSLRAPGQGPHELAFLQIRPLVFGPGADDVDLGVVDRAAAICLSGAALGHGRLEGIRDLVYVRGDTFDRGRTPEIALEVGVMNARLRHGGRPYLLIGPGRWGSADPWLGIPVGWAQISGVRCVVETEMQEISVAPSQGTHFFQNITSFGIGYFTLNAQDAVAFLDSAWLDAQWAQEESAHVRHLSFPEPLEILVDGRRGMGAVMKPGRRAAEG
jgi:DNA-binding NarL/FixJ family response regulator